MQTSRIKEAIVKEAQVRVGGKIHGEGRRRRRAEADRYEIRAVAVSLSLTSERATTANASLSAGTLPVDRSTLLSHRRVDSVPERMSASRLRRERLYRKGGERVHGVRFFSRPPPAKQKNARRYRRKL